ncbi:hypothetical protein HRR83_000513 [Exophiala dermatitidis]|uniref:Uncharacterized protein n=1 Tax=Exophiala dermatitidis TaxID=5970 RepID=A0AAN6J2U1_EXODE|nr:hypothetical protein HRR75_000466 [Exophiala dermatitidis]KAJ4527759.1 hypothetical protein HRR74_000514 [Exophiala dermatitidis]KAJ4528395.1 hypothetical protein HRR73_001018 [Exophiala dermatitidis]KAJ4531351.1 hypothetical protein HRR76_009012 [Exophiala dermatitidis]KAJ4552763.1 hypothetical protein HRR78_003022 [Exophiala dermatitidis]
MPQCEPQVTRTRVPCQLHRISEVLVQKARDLVRANRESWRAAWGPPTQRVAGAAQTGGSGDSSETPALSGARGPVAGRLGPAPNAPVLRRLLAAESPPPSPPTPAPTPRPSAVSAEDFATRAKVSISGPGFPSASA